MEIKDTLEEQLKNSYGVEKIKEVSLTTEFREILHKYLEDDETTISKLCRKTDMNPDTLRKFLIGYTRNINVDTVERICKVIGYDIFIEKSK